MMPAGSEIEGGGKKRKKKKNFVWGCDKRKQRKRIDRSLTQFPQEGREREKRRVGIYSRSNGGKRRGEKKRNGEQGVVCCA